MKQNLLRIGCAAAGLALAAGVFTSCSLLPTPSRPVSHPQQEEKPPKYDASSLRDAQLVVAELDWLPQVHLVMNRIQPKLLRKLRTTIDDAMNTAGLPLIGVIPEDAQVMLCANRGIPLTSQGRKGAAMACRNIAWRLMGRRVPIMRIR